MGGERLDEALLDQPGVAGRVLGLDCQLDRAGRLGGQRSSRSRVSTPRSRDVGSLVVEVCPRSLPGPPVERLQVSQLQRRHGPATVAGAVDPPVVHADQVPVGGEPDVALQAVGTVDERLSVGAQRVLGCDSLAPR